MSNKWRPKLGRWQKNVAMVIMWFSFLDCHVVGFGSLSLIALRSLPANSRATILKDSTDNFPTTLNVPKIPIPTMISSIPQDYPKKIRESIDLVSFIQDYGLPGFKRSYTDRATCICPFHDDHNPSMSIDGTRGLYKCFACGAGGDVFTFVREYGHLQGQQISFQEAVNLVNDRLLSGNYTPGANWSSIVNNQRPSSRVSQAKKSRILLINAAAAAFYEKCLVSRPSAGIARTHLRARGFLPATIKAFGVGYAPDAYFGSRQESQIWGQGSLVEYLTERGFTTADILDAGLATVLKKDLKENQPDEHPNSEMQTSPSSLIDRFRGRLVVPIMDESGSQVLGFGGRILDDSTDNRAGSSSSTSPSFPQPKYLNSPESPVFQKKQILFGQHMATKALRFWNDQDHAPRSVVIVEGYMDAIALWQAGVTEAVACMGTSLTLEQISAAANIAGTKNGRVIVCLDNDEAGIAAVERICRAGILASVGERSHVEFRISTLPVNVKDPADYVQLHKNVKRVDDKFRKEILDESSIGWMDWYQRRVVRQYNSSAADNENNGFASVLDRLGTFLSMVKDGTEKKRRLQSIVDQLVAFIPTTNQVDVSESVRLQIVSELERKSSTPFNKIKSSFAINPASFRKKIEKVGKAFKAEMSVSGTSFDAIMDARPMMRRKRGATGDRDSFRFKKAAPKKRPSLTPHFSGFSFKNKNDDRWIDETGVTGKTSSKYSAKSQLDSPGKVVYFNSNEYHGNQFITDEAVSAGYVTESVPRDPTLLTRGINSMIEVRAEKVLESTEDELLRFLLNFPTTRKSLQSIIDVSNMSGSQKRITWTSQGKAWLFDRLMSDDPALTVLGRGNLASLHAHLASEDGSFLGDLPQSDSPIEVITNANKSTSENSDFADDTIFPTPDDKFSPTNFENAEDVTALVPFSVENTSRISEVGGAETTSQTQRRELDHLFREISAREIDFASLTDDKATIRVQETFYTVLWSSSILEMSQKLQEMTVVAPKSLPISRADDNEGSTIDIMPQNDLPEQDNLEIYQSLRAEIHNAAEQIRSISSARRGLSHHLVQKATPDEVRLSTRWLKDYRILCAQLTEHMKEIDTWSIPDEEDISDDETYETVLQRTFEEWGDFYEDDRLWSPDDVAQAPLPMDDRSDSVLNDNMEESIAAFTARISEEWAWLEESSLQSAQGYSKSGPYEFNEKDWDEDIYSQ